MPANPASKGHIYIIRHGQDLDNVAGILNGHRDQPLSPLGEEQAQAVAKKLKDHDIDVVYSSPLKRAKMTADEIAKACNADEVVVDPEMIERDFGVLTGKAISDIPKYSSKRLQTDRVNYFLEAEGAEDFPTLYGRAERVLARIQKNHSDENVAIVAHGDIGKMIRAVFHGWSWEEGLKTAYFDNSEVLELRPEGDKVEQ